MKLLKKYFLMMPMLLFFATALVSCSEADDSVEEYPDWQNYNTTYFNNIYATAKSAITSGDSDTWKIYKSWSMPKDTTTFVSGPEDYIVVKVLESGIGSGCPLYTDNVWVHYQGRILPSTSYASGYVFDQSYYGTFNENTAVPTELGVSSTVDGFSTALQNMHIGDHWQIYIPYQLGYGTSSSNTTIPAYSVLVFDVRLVSYARSDAE